MRLKMYLALVLFRTFLVFVVPVLFVALLFSKEYEFEYFLEKNQRNTVQQPNSPPLVNLQISGLFFLVILVCSFSLLGEFLISPLFLFIQGQ